MPRVRIALIRHSKSCANHVRHLAGTEDRDHPLVAASQELRDPALSAVGERMARAYGPTIRQRLADAGFHVETAHVGASHLRRAQQTARLLFGRAPRIMPHMTENGAIPENTPTGMRYRTPDWDSFLEHLAGAYQGGGEFIVVGHGSFLRSQVWPAVAQRAWSGKFNNLDAFVVEGELTPAGHLRDVQVRVLRYDGDLHRGPDRCALPAKISALTRMTKRKQQQQRGGGATSMPLAYYTDGAQMVGTYAEPTGVGLAGTSAAWARAPLEQKGGYMPMTPWRHHRRTHRRRRTQRKHQHGGFSRKQRSADGSNHQSGGFSPSIMGQFAANGLKYLPPMVAYSGYKLFKGKSRKTRRQPRRK